MGNALTGRLLGRGITTTNYRQRLVPENGNSTVADCTGGDTALPVDVLTLEV